MRMNLSEKQILLLYRFPGLCFREWQKHREILATCWTANNSLRTENYYQSVSTEESNNCCRVGEITVCCAKGDTSIPTALVSAALPIFSSITHKSIQPMLY